MADEVIDGQAVVDPKAAPADDQNAAAIEETKGVNVTDPEEAAPDPVEALASEMGWAPKDQFRGDEADWKPAADFIKAGKDIQRNLARDLRGVKETVSNMARTSATLLEQQLAEQRSRLEAQFNEAVEAGDSNAARQVGSRIAQLETAQPHTQAPTTEGNDFIERNSAWYGKDQEATNYAIARADHYAKQGLSAARQLAAVEQDMRGIFPDLFPANRAAPKPAPAVAQPTSRAAATSSRQKGFHDLPAEAQAVARDMHDRLGIPVETYVTNFFNQPERKVG